MKPTRFAFRSRTGLLFGLLLSLILVWIFFYHPIHQALATRLIIGSTAPSEEAFFELAKQAADPIDFLQRCWATGKIPHRQLVAAFLSASARDNPPWFTRAEPLLLAGARDGDESVRELAMGVLDARHSPQMFASVQALLNDVDPLMRLLGLDYARSLEPQRGVPMLIPLLDDPDLRVVARAEIALSRWTAQDFGVRARQAIAAPNGDQAGQIDAADAEAIRHGVEHRKQWWLVHAKEYSAPKPSGPAPELPARLPAADFKLKGLAGQTFRLSDERGKVVLLNFWATWCPACLTELPELVGLNNRAGGRFVIIGVSLDGVPDEDGEQDDVNADNSLKALKAKVARTVKARGINYPVLLDPHGAVGGQYNGGELPTTVILDAQGRVRRRFIGPRDPKVFEAMLAEAQN